MLYSDVLPISDCFLSIFTSSVLKAPLNPNHPNEGNGTANGGKGKKANWKKGRQFPKGGVEG